MLCPKVGEDTETPGERNIEFVLKMEGSELRLVFEKSLLNSRFPTKGINDEVAFCMGSEESLLPKMGMLGERSFTVSLLLLRLDTGIFCSVIFSITVGGKQNSSDDSS